LTPVKLGIGLTEADYNYSPITALMYHFLHKHRYWLIGLVVLSAIALFFFQLLGDPGRPLPANQPPPAQNP
jgi:hypothetical protein